MGEGNQAGILLLAFPKRNGGGYDPIEIKLASRLKADHSRNLKYWIELSGRKNAIGTLITDSREEYPGSNIRNLHWEEL
jgi:hypothetical protein